MPRSIAACQFEPEPGETDANLATVDEMARELPDEAAIAVYPELCTSGYVHEVAVDNAAPVPDERTDSLVETAAATDTALVVGLPERADGRVYNTLAYVTGDGVEATYRKQYFWGAERDHFAPSDAGPTTVETPVGRVGLLVCYDVSFPEAPLAYAERACDAVLVPSAWRDSFDEDWRLLNRVRALESTCYVVGVNHAGDQRGRVHAGGSVVASPDGQIRHRLGDGRAVATVEVDPSEIEAGRDRNPVLADREAVREHRGE